MGKHFADEPKRLADITSRIEDKLAPVIFILPLQGSMAVALFSYAMESGLKPETVLAESLRAYLGDA